MNRIYNGIEEINEKTPYLIWLVGTYAIHRAFMFGMQWIAYIVLTLLAFNMASTLTLHITLWLDHRSVRRNQE